MSRLIEQTMLALIPTQAAPVPPKLIDHASFILAQSKIKASAVKPEEETARLYACAHIACDRLKTDLDLPPIVPKPPLPPAMYKRLYGYIDTTVPSASTMPRTPRKNRGTDSLPGSRSASRPLPSRTTPGKDAALAQFRTPSRATDPGTPTKSTGRTITDATGGLPPWVQPTVRFLCKELRNTAFTPTVLAGIETIAAPGGRYAENDHWLVSNLAGIIGIAYFLVAVQVKKFETGENVDRPTYDAMRKAIIGALNRAPEAAVVKGRDDRVWRDFSAVRSTREFDAMMREVTVRNWHQGDWFLGLADVFRQQKDDGNGLGDGLDSDGDGDGDGGASIGNTRVQRADTMFQNRLDYLSKERLDNYNIWKAEMLARIAGLEQEAAEPMDVDTSLN